MLDILNIMLFIFIIYIVIDCIRCFIKKGKKNFFKRIIFYSFIFYLLNVISLTTGYVCIPPNAEYGHVIYIQLIPFRFIYDFISVYNSGQSTWWVLMCVKLNFYNLIMLFPLGIYIPLLFNVRSIKKVTLYVFLTSLTIEIYQLIFSFFGILFARQFNVDDLMLNTLGGLMGALTYKIIRKIFLKKVKGKLIHSA